MGAVYAFAGFIILLLLSDLLGMVFYGFLCLIGYVLRFLALCLWRVLALVAQGCAWVIVSGAVKLGRVVALGFSFIILFIDEWRRGAPPEEPFQEWKFNLNDPPPEEPGEEQPREEEEQPRNPYDEAIKLLGLAADFTQVDFNRAYKLAIRKAHPDTGGSKEQAQAVNTARDCVARRHGWR